MKTLTVLSRSYCHLCDDLITALEEFRGRFTLAFAIDVIDIDQHEKLETLWGDKVPVLLHGEVEVCHYFFNEDAVIRVLSLDKTAAFVVGDGANRLK